MRAPPARGRQGRRLESRLHSWKAKRPGRANSALDSRDRAEAGYLAGPAGGIIRVGFTEEQQARVAELLQQLALPAENRIAPFKVVPQRSISSLETLLTEVEVDLESDPNLFATVAGVGFEDAANLVSVEATNASAAETALRQRFGSLAGIKVVPVQGLWEPLDVRDRQGGRMLGGDRVWTDWGPGSPTTEFTWGSVGFGAFERTWIPQEKRWLTTPYLVDAGHMGNTGLFMYREEHPDSRSPQEKREKGEKIGRIGRDAYWEGSLAVDALATRLNSNGLAPRDIIDHGPFGPAHAPWMGEVLCTDGARTDYDCGRVVKFFSTHQIGHPGAVPLVQIKGLSTESGDSGAPVWDPRTRASVGLESAHPRAGSNYSSIQPLVTTYYGRNHNKRIVGALDASVMGAGSLHIMDGGK